LLLTIGFFGGKAKRLLIFFISRDPNPKIARVLIVFLAVLRHVSLRRLIGDLRIRLAIVDELFVGRHLELVVGFLDRSRSSRLSLQARWGADSESQGEKQASGSCFIKAESLPNPVAAIDENSVRKAQLL